MSEYHVTVKFGHKIPSDVQGKTLLEFERHLRHFGIPAEVFKETMADDSKLRRMMTPDERAKL